MSSPSPSPIPPNGTRTPNAQASVLMLNQFVPPDAAPTARLLGEVAEELTRRGHSVAMVGDRIDYRGKKILLGSRALREAASLARLFLKAFFAPRADAIICLTSPPLLLVAAAMLRLRHRGARLIHWAMDLYPDVAVALGEVRAGSTLHRLCAGAMASAYRRCDLVVALDEEMARRICGAAGGAVVQAPWPPAADTFAPPTPRASGAPFQWLYSGNLGRAHEWETLLEAQALLEGRELEIDLVFQGDGTEIPKARARAEELGLKRCRWQPYAEDKALLPSLLAADALVVTQRPETAGCLWPSKLALVRLLDRPILWIGSLSGEIADSLRAEGHGAFAPGDGFALAHSIAALADSAPSPVPDSERLADRIGTARSTGIARVADAIETCTKTAVRL